MLQDRYGGCHLSLVVTEQANRIIRERSQAEGVSLVDYVVHKALLPIPNSDRLKGRVHKSDSYKLFAKKYVRELKNSKEKEDEDMEQNKKNTTGAAKNGASSKTAQIHLRVPKETAEKIQAEAIKMGMSISDYVTFVVSYFSLEDVSLKLDKAIALLEEWKEGQKKN